MQDDPRGPIYPIAIISDNARAFLNAIWAFTPSPLEEEDFELNIDEYFEDNEFDSNLFSIMK